MEREIPSCLTCAHKDVCIKRGVTIYTLYIQTGRYNEVPAVLDGLNIGRDCENWERVQNKNSRTWKE